MKPIRFNEEVSKREAVIIKKLKDIRSLEVAYKTVFEHYADNFDTLIDFAKNGKIPLIKKKGTVPDSLTEEQAIQKKLVSSDTIYANVCESIFQNKKKIDLANLKYIPFTKKEFTIRAAMITKNSIEVAVFEITAPYDAYLEGLDKQLILNLKAKAKEFNKYEGLRLGSMDEPTIIGNWE